MGGSIVLTIGSLVLLGIFLLAANTIISENAGSADQNESLLTAMSLAQSVIDEAKTKGFDEQALAGAVTSSMNLTPAASLGPEGAEALAGADSLAAGVYASTSRFNDVDDYNNYTRLVNTPRAEGYLVSVRVQYASEFSPDSVKTFPTFCKTMTVTVSSRYLSAPVPLQYAFTY
ncbi:MAG: hypothetical protein WCK00_18400 [Deltaproteobacteria bacterium]